MDLKDIASLSGKSGLFKVVKPTRTGVILETIDEHKNKIIAGASNRVSLLKEISVYTTGHESSKPLEQIFAEIYKKYPDKLNVDSKSSPQELSTFLESVVQDYDKERVYTSDIKKLVSWYATVMQYFPERFKESSEAPTSNATAAIAETEEEEPAKKPKVKKAPAKKKAE